VIVVITFLVGGVVFVQGLHRPSEETPPPIPPAALSSDPASTAPVMQPPVTRVPPKELSVVVGNAVDRKLPVAGTVAAKLNAAGYATIRKKDSSRAQPTSAVYFAAPEWRDDALAVARVLGIDDIDVSQLPTPPPVEAVSGATVYVIVGREPAALSETTPTTTAR
jgi:hypothetical protein